MDRNQQITIKNFKAAFTAGMMELARSYDEDSNDDSQGLTWYLGAKREWEELKYVTTKNMQLTLKVAMKKIETQNLDQRLGLNNFDSSQLSRFKDQYKNIRHKGPLDERR